jgi:DNA gyrase subunit A
MLKEAQDRIHILDGYLKALDAIEEVIKLIRASKDVETARIGLMKLLDIDDIQARAILAMQLSRLAALERQKIVNEHAELRAKIEDFEDILGNSERQRSIVKSELAEIGAKYSDERRTEIVPDEDEVDIEDLIKEEEIVVTYTDGGYIKRTSSDNYRIQHRGGKGVKGAALKEGDIVQNFFVTTTHHSLLFFTNYGKMYRIKAYQIQDSGRDSKGQHIANLLELKEGEKIAQIIDLESFDVADYLVFATKRGVVKKTELKQYDSRKKDGLVAINLREDEDGNVDELVSVMLANKNSGMIMVSKKGMAVKFWLSLVTPHGRGASGVRGMRFREGDELLSASITKADTYLVTVTEKGYAKKSPIDAYNFKGRGGLGVKVANITEEKGDLSGALVVKDDDELLAIMKSAKVIRSSVNEIREMGRSATGVRFATSSDSDDRVIAIARNQERELNAE